MIWNKAKEILESSPLGIGLIILGIFLVSIGGLSSSFSSIFGLISISGQTFINMGKASFYVGIGTALAENRHHK